MGQSFARIDSAVSDIKNVLLNFKDVFSMDLPDSLPPSRTWNITIRLQPGTKSKFGPLYKQSPKELDALKEQFDYLLQKKMIRPGHNPFGAPVLFVPKLGGALRFCVDFCALNKFTVMT